MTLDLPRHIPVYIAYFTAGTRGDGSFAYFADIYGRDTPVRVTDDVVVEDADTPLLMGVVNLSRDSTYRESVAVSHESAVRKARVMAAEGADIVDIGAESKKDYVALAKGKNQLKAARGLLLKAFASMDALMEENDEALKALHKS